MKCQWRSSAQSGWRTLPLATDLKVLCAGDSPPLPAAVSAQVDALWDAARHNRPELFDGRIFIADALDRHTVRGSWTTFRRAYAQLRKPELFDPPLHALSVNGVVITQDDRVLIARRSASAIYLPGGWQSAPAGSVEARTGSDEVDLSEQLAAEAKEELGLSADELGHPLPLIAIAHPNTHVVDIGLLVRCRCTAAEALRRFADRQDAEYDELHAVDLADLCGLLRGERSLLPTARLLFEALLGLDPGQVSRLTAPV